MRLTVRLGTSTFDGDSPNGESVSDAYAKWLDALPRPLPPTADDGLARALFKAHGEWYGEDDPADDLGTRLACAARAFLSDTAAGISCEGAR